MATNWFNVQAAIVETLEDAGITIYNYVPTDKEYPFLLLEACNFQPNNDKSTHGFASGYIFQYKISAHTGGDQKGFAVPIQMVENAECALLRGLKNKLSSVREISTDSGSAYFVAIQNSPLYSAEITIRIMVG
jgi:hypothetical protein